MRLAALTILLGYATAVAQDFTKDVEPIFQKRCQGCHGAVQQMNGLRLDDGQAALRGGYSGPAILPGKSAASPLIHRVTTTEKDKMMPPAGPRLTAAEIGI